MLGSLILFTLFIIDAVFGNDSFDIVAKFRAAVDERLIYLGIEIARGGVTALADEELTRDGRKDDNVLFALLRSWKRIFKKLFGLKDIDLEEIKRMYSFRFAVAEEIDRRFAQDRGDKHAVEADV